MRQELETVLDVVRTVPATDLPHLLGELAEVQAHALARLSTPVPVEAARDRDGEDVLDVRAAASFIGFSPKWVYKNQDILPRLPIASRLKFRRKDLSHWLDQHRVEPTTPG